MLGSGRKKEKTQAPKINIMRGSFVMAEVGGEWRGSLTFEGPANTEWDAGALIWAVLFYSRLPENLLVFFPFPERLVIFLTDVAGCNLRG